LFIVATIGFDLLYAFVIVWLDRRDMIWINVTTNPEWFARQITGASLGIMPQNTSSAIGIRSMARLSHADCAPWASGTSPLHQLHLWQNGFSERLIGSIRRECVDHIIVLGKAHLRRILKFYADYYNRVRTHRSLDKDAPVSRSVQRTGVISSCAILGGLHHRYARV
jgi:hypothetical protein